MRTKMAHSIHQFRVDGSAVGPLSFCIMFDPHTLEDLSKRLAETVPAGLQHLRDDLQRNFHAILQSSLTRMNLVSREEFDVQREVLAVTRTKLATLEARVAELEKLLSSGG